MKVLRWCVGALLLLFLSGCISWLNPDDTAVSGSSLPTDSIGTPTPTRPPIFTPPPTYAGTPTPDAPHATSADEQTMVTHIVKAGESLSSVAQQYGRSTTELIELNALTESELVFVGQQLLVPLPAPMSGPRFKIIPNSELVYGPSAKGFDVRRVANAYDGYLLHHQEEVEGVTLAGPEIVSLVAHRFSVNPRLLLAFVEYRTGWLTQPTAVNPTAPLVSAAPGRTGLYEQLSWAANQLNWGFYGRSEGNLLTLQLNDGSRIAYHAQINDGTAAVQRLLGQTNSSFGQWLEEAGPGGFFATYNVLFGNPFAYTVEPLLPSTLTQPDWDVPWANDETWFLTGGPHGGWAQGSAWAALDFATPGDQLGCVQTEYWVRSMSSGVVTRSEFGAVVVDTDGDGYAGTGWAILYMHIEGRERIGVGERVEVGDPIGHPSCEGGFSNGTHLHLARTYNGRWIAADGSIPFNLNGWVSQGGGREYNGLLIKGDQIKEACECRADLNAIPGE